MLILSLFPGIDLLGRAFEEEWPEVCLVRGPDVLWGGDIRTFHPPAQRFNGIIGGPPCQAFSSLVHLVRANGFQPRFGNLIPDFERCVTKAEPTWWMMENVRAAPVPSVPGYASCDFLWNNCWLPGADGLGQEQSRLRRITFGLRGGAAVDLRRWIEPATLLLPKANTVTQWTPNNSPEAKRRVGSLVARNKAPGQRCRTQPGRRMTTCTLAEACWLQGLPENFLEDAPFRADAKLKMIANGVPLPFGHALAQAIREAIKVHA